MKNNKPDSLPEIGKCYQMYDFGKMDMPYSLEVKITHIIPYEEIDVETKALWESEMEEFSWLYRTDTDLFIKGVCSIEGSDREIIFVRDCDNGWYGLNDWGGQLDVYGNYFKTPSGIAEGTEERVELIANNLMEEEGIKRQQEVRDTSVLPKGVRYLTMAEQRTIVSMIMYDLMEAGFLNSKGVDFFKQ